MTEKSFFEDYSQAMIKVLSSPVTLVLYIIGVAELLSLFFVTNTTILDILLKYVEELIKSEKSKFLASFLLSLKSLFSYLIKNRKYLASQYFTFIPFILGDRDIFTTLGYGILVFILNFLTPLELLVIAHIWLFYNELSVLRNRVITILILVVVIYLDLNPVGKNSNLYRVLYDLRNVSAS